MGRIERIIENCTDCRYCKEFQERGGDSDYVIICTQNEEKTNSGFMIKRSNYPIIECVPIPENCPLPNLEDKDIKELKPIKK